MAAKLTKLTHKIAIAVPFAVLAPGGESGNFWIHARTYWVLLLFEIYLVGILAGETIV